MGGLEEGSMMMEGYDMGQGLEEGLDGHVHGYIEEFADELVQVITSVRVATDYDEVSMLQSDGYDLVSTQFNESGPHGEGEHMWSFFVMAKLETPPMKEIFEPTDEQVAEEGENAVNIATQFECVEDVVWVTGPKDPNGLTIPPPPEGYVIVNENDLSTAGEETSMFVAVKMGTKPCFTRLSMVYSPNVNFLENYLSSREGSVQFKVAPDQVMKKMYDGLEGTNGTAGLLLDLKVAPRPRPTTHHMHSQKSHHHLQQQQQQQHGHPETVEGDSPMKEDAEMDGEGEDRSKKGDVSHWQDGQDVMSQFSGDNSLGDDVADQEVDEEQLIEERKKELELLTAEKEELLKANEELQKKASLLLAREKAAQGVVKNASETQQDLEVGMDHQHEREKQFHEVLQLIVEGRVKLQKQQGEFEQLALDLQTRLDDKEFKAGEISESFKAFKREILAQAVSSRTGKPMSKKLITQFEAAEQKREEDLEKMRLRNITLRTTLKKLERTLRAREQLAEGLHMIDFEQLKIENQALNEKIEERNEELSKLKKKKTVTVQVLTHVREKLRFIENSNAKTHQELSALEEKIVAFRAGITTTKKEREVTKLDIKELRRQQGFATSELLLVDYEKRKGSLEEIKAQIQEMKDRSKILEAQIASNNSKVSMHRQLNTPAGNGMPTPSGYSGSFTPGTGFSRK